MEKLEKYRKEIDTIDEQILSLLLSRLSIVKRIGRHKEKNNIPIIDKKREEKKLNILMEKAKKNQIDSKFIKELWKKIFSYSYIIEVDK